MGNNQNRHSAGTPIGGRFAPSQSAEPAGVVALAEPLDPREQALLDGGWKQVDALGGRAFVSPTERSFEPVGDLEFGYAQEVVIARLARGEDGLDNFRMARLICAVVPDDPDLDTEDPDERPPTEVLMLDGRVETWVAENPGREPADPSDTEMEAVEFDGFAGPGDVRNRPNPFKGLTWNDESGIEAAATEAARTYAEVWGRDEAYAQAMAAS